MGDPGVVYEEVLLGGRYHEDPEEIALYDRAITRLQALAETQEDSRAILQRARKEV
ncbi:Scr1 family TA system antitoxin-like transcriptional regulator [Saccharopolyspora griseoalba]|uniref:Scr1 family TA system antitoxin-like transcriptional regulator n=1 Tax=Saccharopolyspora griseoalba TaxID=1431848 RepID=A0ABW2LTM5_9PSEU